MLKDLLESKNITRYRLSKLTGFDFHTINKIMNNEVSSIRLNTIEKLCYALDCEPGDLIKINIDENTDL